MQRNIIYYARAIGSFRCILVSLVSTSRVIGNRVWLEPIPRPTLPQNTHQKVGVVWQIHYMPIRYNSGYRFDKTGLNPTLDRLKLE